MKTASELLLVEESRSSVSHMTEDFVCWSRMQAEAGQDLNAIVARKELERRAGAGLFFWGVGNAPAIAINLLASKKHAIPVVFSIMKTRPKSADTAPSRVLLWRKYIDLNKIERALPDHVVVTSRGGSEPGDKTNHFALMCYSTVPLRIERGTSFDPSAYRNASENQAPVGASQVTALLRRVGLPSSKSDYEMNMSASLVGSYWVRLTDPLEISTEQRRDLAAFSCDDDAMWTAFARQLRVRESGIDQPLSQGRLF